MKKTSVLLLVTLLLAGLTLASCEKERHPVGSSGLTGFDENGASEALFSVSTSKRVRFSRGNLQYMVSTNSWAFAQNQYDYTGTYSATLFDLFGWGTSGWSGSGATYYQPYVFISVGSAAEHGPTGAYDLTGEYANADWGVYNPISNGGNQAGLWRTLTKDEGVYLLSTGGAGWTKATINGKKGLLLLPDDYEHPDGVTTLPATLRQANAAFTVYELTDDDEWCRMQAAGAVFLPCAGYRGNGSVNAVEGFYWESTAYSADKAYLLQIKNPVAADAYSTRNCIRAVRLVKTI